MWSSAVRTGASAGSSRLVSGYTGAYPAASSRPLRSRSGSSSDSASRTIMPRPGADRPLSMKLMCLWVVPARIASSSWLRWRRFLRLRSA